MKLYKAWGTSFSLIPFLRCGHEPWKWLPMACGCHPDKWGIPVLCFVQPYFLKNDGVSKRWEQIMSHLFCKIMLATTFHTPCASVSYIYMCMSGEIYRHWIKIYMYIYIHKERARRRAHICASSNRQIPQRAESLLLLHGGTNSKLMRDGDFRRHLGTTTAGNPFYALSSFSRWQADEV